MKFYDEIYHNFPIYFEIIDFALEARYKKFDTKCQFFKIKIIPNIYAFQ